ncbi:MAG: heat-inducible transcriptional repressor HrcA [Mycobacteriales bacterium]
MSVEERKLEVLRAIVDDFVSTHEPVGSKALVERHNLGVSPATIRNDMALLEEEGYITQPHTSAGRIPTDKGYRLFVDRLSTVKALSSAERRAIGSFLTGAVDLDDVVRRTVRLLAQLTRQVAVVQYPRLSSSVVRHLELVALTASRLLLVLITDAGRVEQRIIELPDVVAEDHVADLRVALNSSLQEHHLVDVPDLLDKLPDTLSPALRPLVTCLSASILEMVIEHPQERIALAGTANLDAIDFPNSVRPVLEAIEEQVVLLRLFGEMTASTVQVRIGEEHSVFALRTTSVVSTAYGAGASGLGGAGLGAIGVLGPTRMDYSGTMSSVRAVARYVGELLAGS